MVSASADSSSAIGARDVGEDDLLLLDPEPARVHAREVEQVGGELREAVDLLPRRREEAGARLLVEVLVRHQLEEAREGEERRAQLVRGVRDELLARRVELRELDAHLLERHRELAELVVPEVDDRLVELALRDPVRGALEAPDAAGVDGRGGGAEDRRDQERDPRRVEEAALDDPRPSRAGPRSTRRGAARSVESGPPTRRTRGRARSTRPREMRRRLRRPLRDGVVPDGAAERGRVRASRSVSRPGPSTWNTTTRARYAAEARSTNSVERERLTLVDERRSRRTRPAVLLELVDPRVDEPPLERRHDHQVGAAEGAADDREQRDGERRADPTRDAHR